MIDVWLGSPGNQLQADAVRDCDVLISFALYPKFRAIDQWLPSFSRTLIDSGAYSELNSPDIVVDLEEYVDWVAERPCTAWAGLDDIRGDWRRTLKNLKKGGFPTLHNTDPKDQTYLDELIVIARERGGWFGIGLNPPRRPKDCETWLYETLPKLPKDLHVHGFAMGAYLHHERIDSFDSTHWWREAMKLRDRMPWLTYGETLEICVKKMTRMHRIVIPNDQHPLFGGINEG